MDASSVLALDALGQAELVRNGEVSAAELVDLSIAQIEKWNPELNAVIHEHFERARGEARGALPDGPFRGVPILLKDLGAGHAEGDPIHWGTRFLKEAGHRAASTSYLVAKLRAAGFVVVGRTNVPELGIWLTTEPAAYGPTRNPWDPARSCGGSSGGAAAAVAARMTPVAHAGDGGGSLKPSRGRVSLGPEWGDCWSGLISEFALARSIRDTAVLLDLLAGPMPGDPALIQRASRPYCMEAEAWPDPLRVGVCTQRRDRPVHPDCVAAVEATARKLEELGHRVEEAHPSALTDGTIDAFAATIITTSVALDVAGFEKTIGRAIGPDDLDPDNWAAIQRGRATTGIEYADAVAAMQRYSRRVGAWFESYDLLVTPTLPEPPPLLGDLVSRPGKPLEGFLRSAELTAFLVPFNATGQPALSLPLHWNAAGLPIGVQLVAGTGAEDTLIRVGVQLEEAMPWEARRPPLVD